MQSGYWFLPTSKEKDKNVNTAQWYKYDYKCMEKRYTHTHTHTHTHTQCVYTERECAIHCTTICSRRKLETKMFINRGQSYQEILCSSRENESSSCEKRTFSKNNALRVLCCHWRMKWDLYIALTSAQAQPPSPVSTCLDENIPSVSHTLAKVSRYFQDCFSYTFMKEIQQCPLYRKEPCIMPSLLSSLELQYL